MSTIKVTNVQNPSAASAAITLDTNGQATLNGLAYPTSGSLSGRNRVINGDMRIDQRNAGASVTATDGSYTVDRWQTINNQTGSLTFTVQRNAGSITPPSGFTNYLGATVTAAAAISSGTTAGIRTKLEGFNTADLAWGTASAAPVVMSFWARSSLTGTFGGALWNSAQTLSYPFSYSIPAANTWTFITLQIAGPTTATWLTDNGTGIGIDFSMGTGTTPQGTAGSWTASFKQGVSGQVQVLSTNGATFYITGVQLEAGSVATPFERRSYGQELALCQRYYAKTYSQQTVPGTATSVGAISSSSQASTSYASAGTWQFPVTMRQAPNVVIYSTENANTTGKVSGDAVDGNGQASYVSDRSAFIHRVNDSSGVAANVYIKAQATASAEL